MHLICDIMLWREPTGQPNCCANVKFETVIIQLIWWPSRNSAPTEWVFHQSTWHPHEAKLKSHSNFKCPFPVPSSTQRFRHAGGWTEIRCHSNNSTYQWQNGITGRLSPRCQSFRLPSPNQPVMRWFHSQSRCLSKCKKGRYTGTFCCPNIEIWISALWMSTSWLRTWFARGKSPWNVMFALVENCKYKIQNKQWITSQIVY